MFEQYATNVRKRTLMLGASAVAVGMFGLGQPAVAQDSSEPLDDEAKQVSSADERGSGFGDVIVVTAQKRAQNLQDVGVAVTAFSGDQLEAAGLTNAADVMAQVPGAIARRHFPSRGLTTNLFIRGIGQTDFNDGTESSVAPFIDDFYLIQASQADFSTFDVERIEVLRGPQGTIFGRNATGGAVQSVTRRPTNTFSGGVDVGFGNFGSRLIDGFINIPVNDKVQLRFSAVDDRHDPYVLNLFEGDDNDILNQNFSAARAQLRLLPTDDLTIDFKYERGRAKGRLLGDQAIIYAGTAEGDVIEIPENGSGYNPAREGTNRPNVTSEDNLNDARNEIEHLLARVEWDLGNVTFTSITGWLDQSFDLYEDCDSTPNPTCAFSPNVDSEHWTQEFRLNGQADRINWTAGLYYLKQIASNDLTLNVFLTNGGTATPTATVIDIDWALESESFAGFGQIEYDLTDTVTLIGGLRLNKDTKNFEQTRDAVGLALPAGTTRFATRALHRFFEGETSRTPQHTFTRAVAGDLTRQSNFNYSGTLQVNYEPNSDLLLYTSFRRGLKAAGFNNGLVDVRQDDIDLLPYDEEVLHAYEFGWKWEFGGAVPGRLNGAIFNYDYKNFQATSYVGIGNLISNNDAKVTGAEIEAQLMPADGLFVNLGAGFLDTKVKDVRRVSFTDPNLTFTADRELAEAPKFSANFLVRYEWSALGGNWGAQIDGSYTGKRWVDVLNQSALRLPVDTNLNANLSYTHDASGMSIRGWIKNIADRRVPLNLLAAPGLDNLGQVNWNEPRTYGLTVGYKF